MTNLLILIALLQVCTVVFIVYLVSRHNRLLFPIPKGKNTYEARNAMVEILVLKIRGYLTSVQWFAELLQGHSGGELTEEQSQLVAQLAESCQKASKSLECIIKSMKGTAKIADLQLFEISEEEVENFRKRHESGK